MSDEQNAGPDAAQETQPAKPTGGEPQDGTFKLEELPPAAQTYIRELRAEAAERRVALNKAEEERRAREQAQLAEQGRWKELAEAKAKEAAENAPYRERAEALDKIIRVSNEARAAKVPESLRGLIPTNYSPEELAAWFDANAATLTRPIAPQTDAGAGMGGGAGGALNITDEDRKAAALAKSEGKDITAEQIARRRQERRK